jgi:hypothetical protein
MVQMVRVRAKLILMIFLGFALMQSCQPQDIDNKDEDKSISRFIDSFIQVDSSNIPIDSNQGYFPLEVFTDKDIYIGYDTFHVRWYSEHLWSMNEPLLFNKISDTESYRFLWLRTFHNPVSIRIERQENNYYLTWKLSNGAGGYRPGKLVINETKKIDKETWDKFYALIDSTDFWNLKTVEYNFGTDGSQWILEGSDSSRYHVVDRWTPKSGSYYDCCNYLIGLTDLKIKSKDFY